MNTSKASQQLLAVSSFSRGLTRCHIRQWLPRSTPPRQQRHATTVILPPGYKPRSRLRPLIWALAFSCVGFLVGKQATAFLHKFSGPNVIRDSEEDRLLLESLRQMIGTLHVVKEMRQGCAMMDSEWRELRVLPQEGDVLLNETIRGYSGITTPMAFWNAKERELWMIVHYGGAMCGWPGIAHGGCTATVLLEGMGRALSALTGDAPLSVRPPDPSHLGLTYLKPVHAGKIYVLKAKLKSQDDALFVDPPQIGARKDMAEKVKEERGGIVGNVNKKYDIDCVLESLEGVQCMRAKGIWDVL